MVNSKKDEFGGDGKINGSVHENQTDNEVVDESSVRVSTREGENTDVYESSRVSQGISRSSGIVNGLAERLSSILRNEGDGDLLLQQSDRENNVFLQWLQALDLQVIGACRTDERLKPLLKLKVSSGVAEDRLVAHLSQHFEVPEVGMLARCLCIPLVSVRVGKVIKQGTHLCPTAARGRLNLTLLPSSDLRISFVGEDGCTERLATLSSYSESSAVEIEEIPADKSGRSFLVKFPCGKVSYFWCSEQSIPFGFELLAKMKDLLNRKPSLAQLSGVSESRLDCFANHLRAYVLGSVVSNIQANPTASSVSSLDSASDSSQWDSNNQFSSPMSKSSRYRQIGGQAVKPHSLCQGSLSPRSNPFKDGLPRSSTVRSGSREKFRRRGDSHCSISGVDGLLVTSTSMAELFNTSQIGHNKLPETNWSRTLFPFSFLEPLGNNVFPTSNLPSQILSFPQVPRTGSLVSPYYCWCPPCTSNLQYKVTPSHLLVSLTETPSLPSLSSLLSAAKSSSSLVPPNPTPNLSDVPSLCIPALLPDPVVRVPLPVSSFITMSSSQQVPNFTPLICDPIVHIPIIEVCSSGDQGYLVSTDPAISTTISPLYPSLMNQLIPEAESVVEKGARKTLRMLLGSSQTKPQLEVRPDVMASTGEKHRKLVLGSRGLYTGTRDVAVIANHVAAIGFVSLPQRAIGNDIAKGYTADEDDDEEVENRSNGSENLERSGCLVEGMEDSIFLSNDDAIRERSDDV
ncbi:hypothetical protein BVC80_1835g33 [Macleaya cordata]|uniref:Flocculation protein n=1 Tax=Macleaya cordata TaxID=56857 RepID=A0A200R4N5_MACCD|nr:hypothetical protein BVC80_1835g33 [Macleaya cordata]